MILRSSKSLSCRILVHDQFLDLNSMSSFLTLTWFRHAVDGGVGCVVWISAVRQGNCKRMLFRNASGAVRERQLYRVETDPREQEFEIGDKQPAKANELQK
jgi:hypothetical protein